MDYGEIYNLEKYIFETASARFHATKSLDAFDFFCIVIWKANRAKSNIARRLLKKGYSNLEDAVRALTYEIAAQTTHKDRLRCLVQEWGFLMPMASTILTVLYPDVFTVYDYRVMQILKNCPPVNISKKFERTWEQYQTYVERVRQEVPDNRSLRDKDRYLWGRSFSEQLENDIRSKFTEVVPNAEAN